MGRKAIPTAQKKQQGVRKSRINDNEPLFPKGMTQPSSFIRNDRYALGVWRYLVPLLTAQDVLTLADRPALEGLCVAYATWRKAEEAIKRHGMIMQLKNGYMQQRPEVAIAQKYLGMVKTLSAEFGLTPSARSKVTAGKGATGDEHEDFFGDKPKGAEKKKNTRKNKAGK